MGNRLKKDRSPQKVTKEHLAEDLLIAGAPHEMVQRARDGAYDDYESESATPIVDLVRDCERFGLTRLAQAAMDGVYDGTREEAEAWAKSAEGQAILRQFGRRRP